MKPVVQPSPPSRQCGAALLLAMLTAALVATFAAAALWQQWRAVAVESAERNRMQAAWILLGALDWSRVILAEDARTSQRVDHLAEPWAVPLQEARLSTFLAAQGNVSQVGSAQMDMQDAFLSGQIIDLQSRLNLRNLLYIQNTDTMLERLLERLGLQTDYAGHIARALRSAVQAQEGGANLMPRTSAQLGWFGVPMDVLETLQNYVTLLPAATPVNLNTASAEVIWASTEDLSWPQANQLVQWRSARPLQSLADASRALDLPAATFDDARHTVSSQYFEVQGQLRLDDLTVRERSVLLRQGMQVSILWRERGP